MLLEGRVALVTGGASGLGLEVAKLFAAEGAKVVVADVTDERADDALDQIRQSGETRYVHADVSSTSDLEAAVSEAEHAYGRLDTVVANAGIMGRASFTPVEQITDEDWAAVIAVNLTGAFKTFRAAIPALRRAGGGAMSATSSTAGVYGSLYRLPYTASKGGLNALVRGLAVELAPDRIRVNAMCPGSMPTNISESLGRPRSEIDLPMPDPSVKARLRLPEGRNGTVEAARAHLFLCSDLASYVNGESLVVDNGWSMWKGD